MYRIALVCENGASTGMVVKKMQKYAETQGIAVQIAAYPYTQLGDFIGSQDFILLGPQIGYKKEAVQKEFPDFSARVEVISAMDFGMMNGKKILDETIAAITELA